jgi:CheY-like chemotaxis protein/MinD-like ATPase involved in chromosome partitioning or flagellar assembly
MALQRHGYSVIGALSGEEGLRLAREERPDLILLDMMMPEMDGVTVCQRIRQEPYLRDVPVIMFTAKTQVLDKKISFEAGADDYLTKPTPPQELLERVQVLLARRQRQTSNLQPSPVSATHLGAGSRFLTVIGSRGGAGATTLALNLAVTMGDLGQDTLLVDLDTRQGHIALYLGEENPPDLLQWLSLPPREIEAQLENFLLPYGDSLHLLLTRPHLDPQEAALHIPQAAALSTVLRKSKRSVVLDLGANLGKAIYPLLQQSDYTLICAAPERASIHGAKAILNGLQQIPGFKARAEVVMLSMGPHQKLPRASVENFLGVPLLDVIQLSPQRLSRAVNRGLPLVHTHGIEQASGQFQTLARHLVATPIST